MQGECKENGKRRKALQPSTKTRRHACKAGATSEPVILESQIWKRYNRSSSATPWLKKKILLEHLQLICLKILCLKIPNELFSIPFLVGDFSAKWAVVSARMMQCLPVWETWSSPSSQALSTLDIRRLLEIVFVSHLTNQVSMLFFSIMCQHSMKGHHVM